MSDILIIGTAITTDQTDIVSIGTLNNLQVNGIATFPSLTYTSLTLNKIKIGDSTGFTNQQTGAIAIGNYAGQTGQGTNSIAIGQYAGQTNQDPFTTVINAGGIQFNTNTSNAFFVNPIRNQTNSTTVNIPLTYNTTTKEIISSSVLNLGGNFTVDTNLLVVDSVNNRVGINQSTPNFSFQSTGQTNQLGTLVISNNAISTETSIRGQIFLEDTNRRMTFQNNGVDRFILYNEGWWVFNSLSNSHPSSLNAMYGFSGNNIYLGTNNGNVIFRNTSNNTDVCSIDNKGNITLPLLSVIHPTLNSRQNIGYASIQISGSKDSLWGAFRKTSPGYSTVPNSSTFFEITFEDLFVAGPSIDNCGGNLTIFCKRFGSGNGATVIFSVNIAKIYGASLKDTYSLIGSSGSNWTGTPTLGGGTGDVIRINFNSTDTTSPNGSYVAWTFEGCI